MKLPIGMLIYWAHRFSDEHAVISGIWYYKEFYVPTTKEEKIQSLTDLKKGRCAILNISGTFEQIMDILMRCERFHDIDDMYLLINQLEELREGILDSKDEAVIFDDIKNIQGTSLAVDCSVDIIEDMEYIMSKINSKKPIVKVNISKDWSFAYDLVESMSNPKINSIQIDALLNFETGERFKMSEQVKKVTLYHYERPDLKVTMEVYFNDKNELYFNGYDIGAYVEEHFGDIDYEYSYTIVPEEVKKFYPLLNLEDGDRSGLLLAIQERFSDNMAYSMFGDFMKANGIQFKKFYWM